LFGERILKIFFNNIVPLILLEIISLRIKDAKAINILKEIIASYNVFLQKARHFLGLRRANRLKAYR